MLYELRYYEVAAQALTADLHALFADHAVRLFQKHGIGMLGFWQAKIGDHNKVPCMLIHESMGERDARVNAFESDPEWKEARVEADRKAGWPILARMTSQLLKPTYYSPVPKVERHVQEFRVNQAMPGRIADLHHLFANEHQPTWFPKYDIRVVGWFEDVVGTSDQVFFILEFDDQRQQDERFGALITDPGWRSCAGPYESHDRPLRTMAQNRIYDLADYTPRGPYVTAPEVGWVYYGYRGEGSPSS